MRTTISIGATFTLSILLLIGCANLERRPLGNPDPNHCDPLAKIAHPVVWDSEIHFYFERWMARTGLKGSATESELKSKFLAEELASFRSYKQALLDFRAEQLAELTKKVKSGDSISFDSSNFPLIATLGTNMEGTVHLVRKGSELVVIKKFRIHEDYKRAVLAHNLLEKEKVPAARILKTDDAESALMMTYEPGITGSDIMWLVINNKLPSHFLFTYQLFYHQQIGPIQKSLEGPINTLTEEPTYFRPNLGNTSYNPNTGIFTIFDPH